MIYMDEQNASEAKQNSPMNMKVIIGAVVVLVVVVSGFMLVKSKSSKTADDTSPAIQSQDSQNPASSEQGSNSATTGSVKEFKVTGSPFKFEPSTLKVNKGDTVKITFTNSAGTHDFTIDALKVKTKTLAAGESEVVEFTADKVGTYEYYCSVGNHRAMGMKGTLTVE